MPEYAKSADGTAIAYDVTGRGRALVITGGAFNTRHSPGTLVGLLAPHFTVYTWDRRGRGESGDTMPYAVDRETEDLAAVIAAAGGTALVYGHSSGAILALEAAMRGAAMSKIAVYEPPYVPDNMEAMAGEHPHSASGSGWRRKWGMGRERSCRYRRIGRGRPTAYSVGTGPQRRGD
jgi:pimeloyl-ACP methyl ester carboxylesterase